MIHKHSYPQDWPAIEKPFSTQGSARKVHNKLLTLLRIDSLGIDSVCNSEIIKMQDEISFVIFCNQIDTVNLSNAHGKLKLKQKKDYLLIRFKNNNNAGNPLAGYYSEYLKIYNAVDGTMIIKKGSSAYRLIYMLFPFILTDYTWIYISEQEFIETNLHPEYKLISIMFK